MLYQELFGQTKEDASRVQFGVTVSEAVVRKIRDRIVDFVSAAKDSAR